MDTSNPAAMEAGPSCKDFPPAKRQRRSPELKRRIVEETLAPGASVARVARAHGVNANQVFAWRRQYRQGLLESTHGKAGLLAVRVVETPVVHEAARAKSAASQRAPQGMIQLELPTGHLRIAGRVDPEALRVVLEKLLA